MAVWSDDWEVTETVGEDHDYWIAEKHPDEDADKIERYRGWMPADDEWTIVVADDAPEAVFDAADDAAAEGAVWASDAERERVKLVDMDVQECLSYYLDDPPEHRYTDVDRERCRRFLERRGLWDDVNSYIDSWHYPDRDEFVVRYVRQETRETLGVFDSLDDVDYDILFEGYHPDEDEPNRDPVELADLIYEETPVGHREALILAYYVQGTTSHAEMADEMGDIERGAISSSAYHLEDKLDEWCWLAINVLSNVPDGELSEDLASAVDALPVGDPSSHEERDVKGETTLR